MDFKKMLADITSIEGVSAEEIYTSITLSADAKLGDYSLPCFKFAKALRRSPADIAGEACAVIKARNTGWLERVETVGGYVNCFLNKAYYAASVLPEIMNKGQDWQNLKSNGKTICMDFSSINIAKPFHIGHLLTTTIGGSLYQIYKYLGYKVVGINHLGDWGTQFGKLITAYLKWGDENPAQSLSVGLLMRLYVRFHEEAEKDEQLNDTARMWFKRLEDGDKQALELFKKFRQITIKEVKKIYKDLGVSFDSYKGESFFNNKVQEVVRILKRKKLLTESDGAQVVRLDDYNMPPCLILKSDGTTLYATRDLATALYRYRTYHFDKCLYVVAYQQDLHFKQVFKVLELMGYKWADRCVHIPFGMVSLEGAGALSTRKGNVVLLKDVLQTAVKKAYDIIDAKNPNLENKRETAASVGVGSVVFGALASSRIKDVSFSYDKALNFDGETGPYLQYTHARCCSVLEKGTRSAGEPGLHLLSDEHSFAVTKLLDRFDSIIPEAAEKNEPSIISKYLIDLAQSFNKFYFENRIITDDKALTDARLYLTECVKNTLYNGLKLILIKAPVKM